jgi:hypothetical protein
LLDLIRRDLGLPSRRAWLERDAQIAAAPAWGEDEDDDAGRG